MTIQASDISIVYSGGGSNSDPSQSLGGQPSSMSITGVLNNLFDDVTETESADGFTDYRCFYVFNDNETETLHQTSMFIMSQVPGGADIQVGCNFANEQQKVVIVGNVTSGSCTLGFLPDGSSSLVTATMSSSGGSGGLFLSLQIALNGQDELIGCTCSQSVNAGTGNLEILITFGGLNVNRYMPLFTVQNNSFLGDSIQVSVLRVTPGGPLNQIAVQISGSTIPPAGVTFFTPDMNSPIFVGELGPTEGFPVWVKRIVAENDAGLSDDGAVIRITGKPFV